MLWLRIPMPVARFAVQTGLTGLTADEEQDPGSDGEQRQQGAAGRDAVLEERPQPRQDEPDSQQQHPQALGQSHGLPPSPPGATSTVRSAVPLAPNGCR